MYPTNKHKLVARPRSVRGYFPSTRRVKPLSFYVSGGPDVDGDQLKQDKASLQDPDSDADNWMSMYGTDSDGDSVVFADPFCDPRHDVFSIADMSGSNSDFAKAVRKAYEDSQGSSNGDGSAGDGSAGE